MLNQFLICGLSVICILVSAQLAMNQDVITDGLTYEIVLTPWNNMIVRPINGLQIGSL